MVDELRLAVLIDAENVSYKNIKAIMEEVAKYGTPTIKRIYADWTDNVLSGWKQALPENAITPIQQYSYTAGKNSSDSALIIDAMDLLYSEKVDGFCIVSSDSDFTRLATRLREAGMKVYGIGERKTPNAFIAACDKFIYIEIINPQPIKKSAKNGFDVKKGTKGATTVEHQEVDDKLLELLAVSINDVADENGWAFLAEVGNLLSRKQPDFDPRNYGFSKLTLLIDNQKKFFEIEQRKSGNSRIKHIYVRNREQN